MVRLATDTQMKTVAMGLQRAEERAPEDWDRSVSFLYRAWEAPDIWEARKDKPNSFRDDDLRVLARTCDDFVRVLQKERELIVYWFSTIDEDRSHGGLHSSYDPIAVNPYLIERAHERLSALLETIQGIAGAAQQEFDDISRHRIGFAEGFDQVLFDEVSFKTFGCQPVDAVEFHVVVFSFLRW